MGTIAAPATNLLPAATSALSKGDPGLVDAAKRGDRQAFLALFATHAGRIYSQTSRLTGSVEAAEKLTRDIFIEAFSHLGMISDDDAFQTLLQYALKKALARHLRRAG